MTDVGVKDLLKVFLKLGAFGFGGPAAHIAMMREEIVEKRKWIDQDEFFDLVGATNLIPGPNSTELAIHIGYKVRGKRGMLVSGIAFIIPAFFCVLSLALFYTRAGSLPELSAMMTGVRPVIVAIVFLALLKFRESAVKSRAHVLLGLLSIVLVFQGINEVLIIFFSGLLLALYPKKEKVKLSIAPLPIFLYFLKIGSVLFGSGYVLLAFLQNELVKERGWLTSTQLLDAVTVGQVTPGPVFTTGTFIGFLLGGSIGAVAATVGIFLPSFFLVLMSAPFLPKLRSSQKFSLFLDGVNASSFALMAWVTLELGQKSVSSIPAALICFLSLGILKITKLNSAWAILASALIGFFFF